MKMKILICDKQLQNGFEVVPLRVYPEEHFKQAELDCALYNKVSKSITFILKDIEVYQPNTNAQDTLRAWRKGEEFAITATGKGHSELPSLPEKEKI